MEDIKKDLRREKKEKKEKKKRKEKEKRKAEPNKHKAQSNDDQLSLKDRIINAATEASERGLLKHVDERSASTRGRSLTSSDRRARRPSISPDGPEVIGIKKGSSGSGAPSPGGNGGGGGRHSSSDSSTSSSSSGSDHRQGASASCGDTSLERARARTPTPPPKRTTVNESSGGTVMVTDGVQVVKRELDTVALPALPHDMFTYMWFRNKVTQAFVTTSCRGQAAFDFITIVECKTTTFEELAYCPPEFDSAEMKLLQAIMSKEDSSNILCLEINQYYESAKQERRRAGSESLVPMLRGRQALWLIYEHFRTTTSDGTLYGFRHFQLVEWKGDEVSQLEHFDAEVTRVLGGMENMPREEDINDHYVRQFRKTKTMKEDIAYFDRLENGHPDKSWKYLRKCLRKQCFRIRATKNEDQLCPPEAYRKAAIGDAAAAAGAPKSPGACVDFLMGNCKFGDKCIYKHFEGKAAKNKIIKTLTEGNANTYTALTAAPEADKKKEKAQREKEKGDKKGKKGDKGDGKGKGKSKGNDIDRSRLACLNLAHWGTCERHKKGECQYNHTDAVIKKFKDSKHWKPSVEAYNNMKSQGCTQWNPGKAGKP